MTPARLNSALRASRKPLRWAGPGSRAGEGVVPECVLGGPQPPQVEPDCRGRSRGKGHSTCHSSAAKVMLKNAPTCSRGRIVIQARPLAPAQRNRRRSIRSEASRPRPKRRYTPFSPTRSQVPGRPGDWTDSLPTRGPAVALPSLGCSGRVHRLQFGDRVRDGSTADLLVQKLRRVP